MLETQPVPETYQLQLNSRDLERRKKFIALQSNDIARIATVRDVIVERADQLCATFFEYLSTFEEASGLFHKKELLDEAKRLKREHLCAMVSGEYGSAYVEQRVKLGMTYSKTGIDVRVFLGAFYHLMREIGTAITVRYKHDPTQAFEAFMSLEKICFFDIGIITDVLVDARERTIKAQQKAILELSTPVLQLRDRLLILPIIGMIDSQRAKQLTDTLLRAIRANRAKIVVIDITGVAAVDSKVANHLMQTVTAARLMGTKVIITGLSAEVAQSLAALGVDRVLKTVGDLQGGLEEAERLLTVHNDANA
jgi:rsbT co-antagonist protein RsbR